MLFKLSYTLTDIKKYYVIKENLYIQKTNNQIVAPGNNLESYGEDFSNSGEWLFWNNENKAISYNTITKEKKFFPGNSFIKPSIHENSFYALKQEKDLVLVNALSGQEKTIETNYNWDLIFEENSNVLLYSNSYVIHANVWKADLSSFGKIIKIMGAVSDQLWLWCEPYCFVCLNITSGRVLNTWTPFDRIFDQGQFYFNFPYFDQGKGNVLFFERDCFIECDLNNKTTHIIWQDKNTDLNIISSCFTSDFIYFTAAKRASVFSRIIGIFDRSLNAIAWQEEIPLPPGVSLKEAEIDQNKLYVLDTTGILHAYEKKQKMNQASNN